MNQKILPFLWKLTKVEHEHAIVQLVDWIIESFEYNKYTVGVSIDLSKAFDTVDHSILLKKLVSLTKTTRGWKAIYQRGNNLFK